MNNFFYAAFYDNNNGNIMSIITESWKVYDLEIKYLSELNNIDFSLIKPKISDCFSLEHFMEHSSDIKYYETINDFSKNNEEDRYVLKLYVSELNYGNFYHWRLFTDKIINYKTHPFDAVHRSDIKFFNIENKIYASVGNINPKNELMDCLFNTIMDLDKLKASCGTMGPQWYQSRLIRVLCDLSD